jgi:hypothetical protein
MNFIKNIFKTIEPAKGEVWVREPNNPFGKSPVTVIDIKDGYILYKYSTGGTSSETVKDFKRLYTKE